MLDENQCQQFWLARNIQRETLFIKHLKQMFEFTGSVADLGCGTGNYDHLLCEHFPNIYIDAYDASPAMIALARQHTNPKICLIESRFEHIDRHYENIVSVDTLHHVHDPQHFWQAIDRMSRPGTKVFVMDHVRPSTEQLVERIVRTMATTQDSIYQTDFKHSLMAAHDVDEIQQQLKQAGLPWLKVSVIGQVFQICLISGVKP